MVKRSRSPSAPPPKSVDGETLTEPGMFSRGDDDKGVDEDDVDDDDEEGDGDDGGHTW